MFKLNLYVLLMCSFCLASSCQKNTFENWVQTELESDKQTILLPKGTHHIYPENVSSRTLHLSNNDDGLKNILFDLSDRENIIIDGNGAELIMHGHVISFYMKNAKNITIKNLIIDWANPFFAQGEIVDVGKDFFTVQFDKDYPCSVINNELVFLNPDLPEPIGFNNINFFNPKLERLVFKSWDEYLVGMEHKAELLADNRIRIHSTEIRSPLKKGYIAVFQYEGRSSPVIAAHGGRNIKLSNLTQYHAGAIANLFEGTTDIYIDSLKMVRRPQSGRWFTSHHDVTHFVDCRGDIHLKNSKFEFQGDDDCNIHGIYRPVARKRNDKVIDIKLIHFQQIGVQTLFEGDVVGFYDNNTLELLGVGKLLKVIHRTAQETTLEFEEQLPELDWRNIVVALRDHNINVKISNNHFSNHRARGLLIKTLGKVRIHDNYFHVQGAAIKINNDASGWYEAGPVEDVEIYNNTFDQCNNGGFSSATFEFSPQINDPSSEVPIFKNIRIYNNTIIQIFKPILIASHVENLEFYDNKIIEGKDYPQWHKGNTEPDDFVFGNALSKGQFQNVNKK